MHKLFIWDLDTWPLYRGWPFVRGSRAFIEGVHCSNNYALIEIKIDRNINQCIHSWSCREPTPRYGFVILNTLHSESSIETISPGMEFRVQEPFLLYKNTSGVCLCVTTSFDKQV